MQIADAPDAWIPVDVNFIKEFWLPDAEILNLKEFKTLDVLSKLEGLWLNRDGRTGHAMIDLHSLFRWCTSKLLQGWRSWNCSRQGSLREKKAATEFERVLLTRKYVECLRSLSHGQSQSMV